MAQERRDALAPGVVTEGYRIETVLGAGGFGITYRATEVLLNRSVAIKEYLPSGIAMREQDGLSLSPIGATETETFAWGMDRFRSEAQILVGFRHPNIVSVLRYFETNGTGYLVMEFVEGRTLGQLLEPDKALDETEVHEIIGPLLDGLEAVHEQGFLHRDIKPANIFIRQDGSPVLIDFGAARFALGQQSKTLTSIVSAGYAPYEQYDSVGKQGAWTDVYAIGGVLYRCVTGTRPAEAPSRVAAVFAGDTDPMPTAASAAKVECSNALLAAIDTALAIREANRPQTVNELRSLIGVASQTVVARPATEVGPSSIETSEANKLTAPAARSRSRRKVLAPLSVVLVGAAAAVTWVTIDNIERAACLQVAKKARAAIAQGDLLSAKRQIGTATTKDCANDTLADLRNNAAALEARKKAAAEAERKRLAEKTRRKAATEAERKRQEAEREQLEERRRKVAARVKELVLKKKCSKCDLSRANLRKASLHRADLRNAKLIRANLISSDLRFTDLTGADLRHADLTGANLFGADLRHADLSHTNLRGADLSTANLFGADLRYADLTGANLWAARLYKVNLTGTNLSGATFQYARLSGAKFCKTTMPDHSTRNDHCK